MTASADRPRAVRLTSGTAILDEPCALVHPIVTVPLVATVENPDDVTFSCGWSAPDCIQAALGPPLSVESLTTGGGRGPSSAPAHSQGVDMVERLRKITFEDGETRPFEGGSGRAEIVNTPHGPVGRGTFLPGWRWSEHVKPIAGTDSCQAAHVAYVVSGRMTVTMDDGTSQQFGPGDLMVAGPGHDAAVDGDEACVIVDWEGASDYARRPVLSSFTRLSGDD